MVKDSKPAAEPPRKKLTAYFMFLKEERQTVACDNPGMKLTDISKVMGKKWREMTDEKKEEYSEKARKWNAGE